MNTPIEYIKDFVKFPNTTFSVLWNELAWERRDKTPRREYYCNEIDVPYTYGSGEYARTYYPKPWHDAILGIKRDIEEAYSTKFEVCFLNGYENSKDQLGWHSDNSPEMDDDRPIAIVSLGAEREIWFRDIPSGEVGEREVHKVLLNNGSLCIMKAGMQDTHQHRIPKSHYECGPRISLTFRGYKL